MRQLAHISDLHFGRTEAKVVEDLLQDLHARAPDLVVISGDLTQRARHSQFRAARAFIDALPSPHVVVPGNHDLAPLYRPFTRMFDPFRRYRRHINADLEPVYRDDGIAVIGLNSARPMQWKEGRVSSHQLAHLRRTMADAGPEVFKVVCTHHPFLPPIEVPNSSVVRRARRALRAFEAVGVELLLAGHLHRGFSGDVSAHYPWIQRSILVVQAATATSTRLREEPNGYNWITVDLPEVVVEVRSWTDQGFGTANALRYAKVDDRWTPAGGS